MTASDNDSRLLHQCDAEFWVGKFPAVVNYSGVRTVIYPGSFDPMTNGHLDIVRRASRLFDSVIVAIANNEEKKPLFTLKERIQLVEHSVEDMPNVRVDSFNGLLVSYVEHAGGQAIIRGLR